MISTPSSRRTSSAKPRILSPDSLTAEQSATVAQYLLSIPKGSTCVNVMLGAEAWDLRPLVLENGKVMLYRATPPDDPSQTKELYSELVGFQAIGQLGMRVLISDNGKQCLLVRPYAQKTINDAMRSGELDDQNLRLQAAQKIIELVGLLRKRNLVHGHLSPKNIGFHDGSVLVLDPRVGALSSTPYESMAPEMSNVGYGAGSEVPKSADLYGLGLVLRELLSNSVTPEQHDLVDQLLLPSPKHRAVFSEIEGAFGDAQRSGVQRSGQLSQAAEGRLLSAKRTQPEMLSHKNPSTTESDRSRSSATTQSLILSSGNGSYLLKGILGFCLLVAVLLFGLLQFFPTAYYELAHYIPFLSAKRNLEHESDWNSGERGRMSRVARAALIDHDLAAENAIIDGLQLSSKGVPPQVAILRRVFDPLWRNELKRSDEVLAFRFALAPLVAEATTDFPSLVGAHPAVLLAIAGFIGDRIGGNSTDSVKLASILKGIPIVSLAELPDPIGQLFSQFAASGVKELSSFEALGLAAIVSGSISPQAIEGYLGDSTEENVIPLTLARIALIFPIVSANPELANQLVTVLKEKGGILGDALSWFDVEQVANWNGVRASDKLRLVLAEIPERALSLAQYSDLLSFPLPAVRKKSATLLKEKFFSPSLENMLTLLSGDQSKLTRAQVVSLLSSLRVTGDANSSFISTWFSTMNPDRQGVLLLLLSRGNLDGEDLFNLEAARYLKKGEWSASLDILRALSKHPETLVRGLAYSRLHADQGAELSVLKDALKSEKDPGLRGILEQRLNSKSAP